MDGLVGKSPNTKGSKVNNINIHTYKKGLDHYPIKSLNGQQIIKKLLLDYCDDKNVVLEYAIDYIEGKNFEMKLKNYIESARIINDIKM